MILICLNDELSPEDKILKLHQLNIFIKCQFGGTIINETNTYILWKPEYRIEKFKTLFGAFNKYIRSIYTLKDDLTSKDIEDFLTIIKEFEDVNSSNMESSISKAMNYFNLCISELLSGESVHHYH